MLAEYRFHLSGCVLWFLVGPARFELATSTMSRLELLTQNTLGHVKNSIPVSCLPVISASYRSCGGLCNLALERAVSPQAEICLR